MIFKNSTEAFEMMYNDIVHSGETFAGTKALFNQSFTIESVLDRSIKTPERNFKEDYAEYEWNWYLKGDRNADEISERAKIWKNMVVPNTNGEVNSNYGYFWNYNDQLKRVVLELDQNPNSRRAIIVHYHLDELDRYKHDTPCNDVLNFYIKNGKLELTVFARSIDLWFGFCNDFYTFSKLMELVAASLDLKIGSMHLFVTNLHVYERHWNKHLSIQ